MKASVACQPHEVLAYLMLCEAGRVHSDADSLHALQHMHQRHLHPHESPHQALFLQCCVYLNTLPPDPIPTFYNPEHNLLSERAALNDPVT